MDVENKQSVTNSAQNDERLWRVMEKTLNEATKEQGRRRRWGILFKGLTFVYLFALLALFLPLVKSDFGKAVVDDQGRPVEAYTAVIKINGKIAADADASADRIIVAVRKAFDDKRVKGIILQINSGGGSPVQSGYIYDEIKRLKALHPETKVYAVISDIGASGAYYIAVAADEIYADKASLVGSIGVTAASFGFVEGMEKLGVERRLYTSGKHKAFLDPFMPMRTDEVDFWGTVLNGVHDQFIDVVREGRGARLKESAHPDLYSGLVWNGEQALDMGLIDALGSARYVAREIIKAPDLVDFSIRDDKLLRLMKQLGASAGASIFTKMGEINLN